MKKEDKENKQETAVKSARTCGIVMPISSIGECNAEHWAAVLQIIKDVANEAGLKPNLVSDSDESGIIQKRIIQNLYDNDIVICDVSEKNPNVMFELGIRLAFDKPTIIIKDELTDYSFDTGVIEHLPYPRNLSYWEILRFKEVLKTKINNTLAAAKDPEYSTFLKSFGEFKIAKLETRSVSKEEFILSSLDEIKAEIRGMKRRNESTLNTQKTNAYYNILDSIIRNIIEEYCKEGKIERWRIIGDDRALNDLLDYMKVNHKKVVDNIGLTDPKSRLLSVLTKMDS